jgi:2-C-methyl-D-erythritol 4-phosphate cytidylyltransferase
MGGAKPKQYLSLLGRPIIESALDPFIASKLFSGIVVVLAVDDVHWSSLSVANHPRIRTVIGGSARVDSVKAGLAALAGDARDDDWVLVHDAARPCLSTTDLQALIDALRDDPVGGILATPLTDTLKRSDQDQKIVATVPRANFWRALTPQMFRYSVLARALAAVTADATHITDESSAVEALHLQPRLVQGSADNVKITLPADLLLAESILKARGRSRRT